jgi:hypothetical protein
MCTEIPTEGSAGCRIVTTCAAIMTSACVLRVTASSNRADWTRCSGRWLHVTFTFQHGQSCGASRESELAGGRAHPPADTVCIQQRSCSGSGLPGFELGTADTESLRGKRRRVEDFCLLGRDARKLVPDVSVKRDAFGQGRKVQTTATRSFETSSHKRIAPL